ALSVYSTILYNYDDYDFGSSLCSEKEMQYLFFTYCADLDNIGAGENQTIDQLKGEWGYTDFDMISGASVRLKTESGIRFGAAMSNDYYSSFFDKEGNPTDETREFGTVIAPTTYFNGISAGSDYIAELLAKKAAGTVAKEPLIILCTPFQKSGSAEDSPWYINGSIANILYNNYNRSFTGICFIRTGTAGNYSYTYANFGSFDAISRSVIDVAVKASNDTDADLTESEMAILGGLVKYGVNKANGVSEADKENAPSITVSIDNSDVLYGVGETATLSATVSPSLGLQVVFSSSDDTVATVLNGNNLLCLKSGTATITASCGGYTDTFDITVCDYTVNAPNYLAIGGTATLSITSASELGTASYTSSNSAIVSVSGSVITANAAGSTTITVRVSETAQVKTVKITVIDADALFGSSGVSKDFTEDETLWSYGNANSDPDVQINYDGENVKADGNNRKRYALEYYRSLNTGSALDAATRNGSLLYLDSDIVKIAIAKGYKYLTYKYLCDANGYASFTTVDGIAVGAWLNSGVATNWRFCTIDLTNPSLASIRDNDDFGVGFYTYSQYLYLSEVRFVGGDISGDIEDYLEDNLAQSTVYNKAFVKAMNASSDIGFDTDTITVSRNSNSIAYDKGNTVLGNHVYLDADWIKAAKALGYTRIQMRLSASASAAAGLYRVPYTSITSTSNSLWSGTLTTAKTFVNVSLESFNDGDSLAFAFNSASGQILKISEIQFMSGDLVVPTSVSVSASDYYVQKGETLQLEPTVLPDASYDKSVSYTSSATGVATVSTSGLVSAKTVGTSTITITATVSGVSTTCTIHVVDISLKKFIAKGQSVDLSGDYDYTVSDGGSYASVSGDTLTGTGNGVATITVSKSGQDITDIDVRVIDFTTVDFAEDATIWGYHDTYGDTVSITTVKDISDSRANPITYDALRYYRAENTGTARARTNNMLYLHPDIIAAAQEMGYSRLYYKIYIPKMNNTASTTNYIVMNCKEDGDVAVIPNGSTNVIQASVDNNAQWTTKTISLTEVATTQQGLHADTGIGFAVNGQNTYLSHVFFAGISLETTSSTIKVGDTVQLEPTIMHSYDTSVSYTSNDTSVATVSASGLITAVSAGSATITLTADQSFATATYTVSVMGDVPKYIAKGQSVEIGDGLEYEITEGSSYISISDGILTGIANGTATFTV
ncbi:MAG: Ig-like domain-containing protein, partial [Clostridia bacterium]|nr:Ig-like domain-containing protein [Clostridia bacterium]